MLCPERAQLLPEYRTHVNYFRDAVAAIRNAKSAADSQELMRYVKITPCCR
jgi:hypothetical protein